MRCDSNKGFELIPPFEIVVSRNNLVIDLGTLTDEYEKEISIHTTATSKDGEKTILAGKEVTIVDTIKLDGLTKGTKYQLKGWQMLKEENVVYVAGKGKKHTFNLAESFAREKSGGKKVTYTNSIAVAKNGGWRYGYGNMFYVELVNQYLAVPQVSGELAQKVMNEALKYQGWKYVYGGSNPNTSFDCSGLTQWCYGKAGISLPRTAQAQYDATQHLPLSQAKAGDLVFFHSTYNAGSYVTHVGIYVGNNQMYHAGDPIGYADLSSSYWQQHLIGAGRVKQ